MHVRQVFLASAELAAPYPRDQRVSLDASHPCDTGIVTDDKKLSTCRRRRQDLALDTAMQVFGSRANLVDAA